MGKAKPAKHTSAELAGKAAAALTNKGGGAAGKTDRLGGKVWHGQVPPVVDKRPYCLLFSAHIPALPDVWKFLLLQAGSHAKYKCYVCAQMVPDMKTMQVRLSCKCLAYQPLQNLQSCTATACTIQPQYYRHLHEGTAIQSGCIICSSCRCTLKPSMPSCRTRQTKWWICMNSWEAQHKASLSEAAQRRSESQQELSWTA